MVFKSIILVVFFISPLFVYGARSPLENKVSQKRLLLVDSSSSKSAVEGSQKRDSKSVSTSPAEGIQEEIPESIFDLNKKEPQAKGLILAFKSWPLKEKEKALILKKTNKAGLKKKSELERFKTWVFEWPKWHKGLEAEKFCKEVSNLSFLDYCEPEYLLEPGTGWLRKKTGKKIDKTIAGQIGPKTPQKDGPKLNPPEVPANQTGDIKTCNIASSQLNLKNGQLSDYWAQERIGADLLKEELKKATPVKKHLVAVFDTPYIHRHDMNVRNLISGKGKQAVLPPLGNNMTSFDATIPSHFLSQSNHLLNKVKKECKNEDENNSDAGTQPQGPGKPPGWNPPGY